MILRSKHLAPILFAAFVIGIGGTMVFNLWQTTSTKIPVTYTSGEFAGEYDPMDIRGSYTFAEIGELFEIPLEGLATAFGIGDRENPGAFECKELEELYGEMESGEVGTDSVRWFVALYRGLPYTPNDDTLLPSPAISILKHRLSEAEVEEIRNRTVSIPGLKPEAEGTQTGAATTTYTGEEVGVVKGKTTFGELLSWGVPNEAIEEALGLPVGKPGTTLRDYTIENGIEFSSIKDALQAAVDEALGKQ